MENGGDGGDGCGAHNTTPAAAAAAAACTISYTALQRSRTTIEDFACTYFPLHGLQLPKDLFRFLDILVYVEATIYQMDEDNEALSAQGRALPGHRFPAAEAVRGVLQARGLWDARICAELDAGQHYWELERRICCAMEAHDLAGSWRAAVAARREQPQRGAATGYQQQPGEEPWGQQHLPASASSAQPGGCSPPHQRAVQSVQQVTGIADAAAAAAAGDATLAASGTGTSGGATAPGPLLEPGFALAEALAAHEAKSFDYRLLHLVLHKLIGAPYDEGLLAFMEVDERLVDIGDDLTDYEDDVAQNSFNIYRAYLHMFGPDAQLQLADRIGDLERRRAALLARLPARQRTVITARQTEAVEGQGSDKWVMPAPILRERAFRAADREHAAAAAVVTGVVPGGSDGGGVSSSGGGG